MIKKDRKDFVLIRLTAAGEKLAGGSLTHSNRHLHYTFKPGEPLEVEKSYEWSKVLSRLRAGGEPVFELAPENEAAVNDAAQDEATVTEDANAGI